jgi:hypothetical protein
MAEIFLGKRWHWGLLTVAFIVLAMVGQRHLHTYAFNSFSFICLLVGIVTVSAVVFTYRPGDRVTRDPIELPDDT